MTTRRDAEWYEDDPGVVRPFTITGGRTRPAYADLELETLVSTTPRAAEAPSALDPEQHAIALLCRQPVSVAEVSARLDVPLGVARVLVGDMAAAGLVAVHRPAHSHHPDLLLLERVLQGLRAI